MKRIITLSALTAALCLTATSAFADTFTVRAKLVVGGNVSFAPTPSVRGYWPHAGTAGTTVTIRGENFARATKVIYGGTLVIPRRVTGTSITFDVPRYASDASIALRAPNRRWDLRVGAFDVQEIYRSYPYKTARWRRAFLASTPVKAELSMHSLRIARLERMKLRTRSASLTVRINAAIRRENRRHATQMTELEVAFRLGRSIG